MPPEAFDPAEMTDVQKAFWRGMTDQRVANLWDAAGFIAELSKPAKEFLRNAEPETLEWLERASPQDIDKLKDGIKFTEAVRLLGRAWFWFTATGIAALVAAMALWEKLSAIFKAKP
jgi:hypothetical protein